MIWGSIYTWVNSVCVRYANRVQEVVRTDATMISIKIRNYWATGKLNNKITTNHLMAASPGLEKPKNFLNGGFTTLKINKVWKGKWIIHFRRKCFVLISHIYMIFLFGIFISIIPVWTLKLHKPFLTARQPAGRGNYRSVGSYWKIRHMSRAYADWKFLEKLIPAVPTTRHLTKQRKMLQ